MLRSGQPVRFAYEGAWVRGVVSAEPSSISDMVRIDVAGEPWHVKPAVLFEDTDAP